MCHISVIVPKNIHNSYTCTINKITNDLFYFCFVFSVDREKRSVNSGDEPGLCKTQVLSDPSVIAAAIKSITDTSVGNNGGYVPTVGRWGSEWPS